MPPTRIVAIVVAALGVSFPAMAQKNCTRADESNAGKVIDRASTWPAIQRAWKEFRHCDKGSGPVNELFTEALLRTIIDWKGVDAFAEAMKDTEFRDFVHGHLRSPAAKDDLPDIYSRAKKDCPKAQADFCAQLAEAVKPAAPVPLPQFTPIPTPAPAEKK